MAIKKFCSRCNKLIDKADSYCDSCKEKVDKERNRAYNKKRYNDEDEKRYQRFYNSTAWKRTKGLRLMIDNGLCVECFKKGILTKATTVHHIIELKQDWSKRLDIDNLESLCHNCHNDKHNRF